MSVGAKESWDWQSETVSAIADSAEFLSTSELFDEANKWRAKSDILDRDSNKAQDVARELKRRAEARQLAENAKKPVDRTARTLTDGSPVTDDHRELKPNGQQKDYVVLSEEERAKGYVRPVRRTYTHTPCGGDTTMSQAIAETYARDPFFYSGTFCVDCGQHFPLDQFVWKGTDEQVGS